MFDTYYIILNSTMMTSLNLKMICKMKFPMIIIFDEEKEELFLFIKSFIAATKLF